MPRGVKRIINYEEELKKIDAQLKALHKQRDALTERRRKEAFSKLNSFMSENGISAADAVEFLSVAASTDQQSATEV